MTNYFRELHPISTGVYFLGMLILIMMASYNKSMVILFLALSVQKESGHLQKHSGLIWL